ncbi:MULTISPECIES: hypothetical protein [Rhizobium]|uniref:hypothetical protein n=1 Tax=Rhizobium TaxID=379 RepID=UPI00197D3841|nr:MULTISPECIES: hypothetical protein [Rhizobium]MCW0014902.1 hypothetical protein [Rhizobium sp. BT-226]NKM69172.1 hypothetical protein [Rhizobium laguerreae]
MRIKIIAPFKGATSSGLYGKPSTENPSGEIPIGTEIDVEKEPTDWVGRYEVVSGSTEGKEPILNSAYAVESKGGGYSVITKDGEPVTKGLRKDDLEGFDTLSEEDRAAFVELHKKDA